MLTPPAAETKLDIVAKAITGDTLAGSSATEFTLPHATPPSTAEAKPKPQAGPTINGVPRTIQIAGVVTESSSVTIDHPFSSPIALQIMLYPTVESSLLEMVKGKAASEQADIELLVSHDVGIANNLLAAVSLSKLYPARNAGVVAQVLDDRIRTLIGLLVVDQNDAGFWKTETPENHLATTAMAYWSLVNAKKGRLRRAASNSLNWRGPCLRTSIGGAGSSDLERKAIVAHVALRSPAMAILRSSTNCCATAAVCRHWPRPIWRLTLLEMDRRDSAVELLHSQPPTLLSGAFGRRDAGNNGTLLS